MSKKVAVVISGCGHQDGAELRESILSLLYLDINNAEIEIFAPDKNQAHVINHLDGTEKEGEVRNVLIESARVARGDIKPLEQAKSEDFDALLLPGGFGAAKNCSTLAFDGPELKVDEDYGRLINEFYDAKKPVGAMCIAPAVLVAALKDKTKPEVTVGEAENNDLISSLGGVHHPKDTNEICLDEENKIVTTSAYMREDRISKVSEGIRKLVEKLLEM